MKKSQLKWGLGGRWERTKPLETEANNGGLNLSRSFGDSGSGLFQVSVLLMRENVQNFMIDC